MIHLSLSRGRETTKERERGGVGKGCNVFSLSKNMLASGPRLPTRVVRALSSRTFPRDPQRGSGFSGPAPFPLPLSPSARLTARRGGASGSRSCDIIPASSDLPTRRIRELSASARDSGSATICAKFPRDPPPSGIELAEIMPAAILERRLEKHTRIDRRPPDLAFTRAKDHSHEGSFARTESSPTEESARAAPEN